MNILIIGNILDNLVCAIQSSNLLNKLYTASFEPNNKLPNIVYEDFDELVKKAETLQIDIAINTDKNLIYKGIVEAFKPSRVNLISVNKKWMNLETSKLSAKQLMNYYAVNNPAIIKVPRDFPIAIQFDAKNNTQIANSFEEVVEKLNDCHGEKTYLEEYMEGDEFDLYGIWDSKNVYFFNSPNPTTEVKDDRLYLLKTKLNFMFSDEQADFTGFFTIQLVWSKNDWYVKRFIMGPDDKWSYTDCKNDLLYILNSAIYQKLNDIRD